MALPPVVIRFLAEGVPDVQRAFKSIAAVAAEGNRAKTTAAARESSSRVKIAQDEARDSVRAHERAEQGLGGARRAGNREAEQAARADVRRAAQAASEKLRIAERLSATERRLRAESLRDSLAAKGAPGAASPTSASARLSILEGAKGGTVDDQKHALSRVRDLGEEHKANAARVKSAQTAAAAETKAVENAAKDKIKAMNFADRELARARDRGVREAEKAERQKASDAARWLRRREAEERQHAAKSERIARTLMGSAGAAARTAGRVGSAVVGGIMQIGGGLDPVAAVQHRIAMRGKLADIANRAIIADDPDNAGRRSVDSLQGKANAVGARWGIDPDKAVEGLDKFASKTGKLNVGLDLLEGLGEMSRAGAGDLQDLADAAGDVFNADKTQSADKVLGVMRALAAQGKIGAVEMKDLAKQMATLGAAAGQFQGDAGKNMAFMGGLAQMARESGGAKSSSIATNSVQSLTSLFYKNARLKGFAELGVVTKDEKTGFNRDLDAVLIDTLKGAERVSRKGGHGMRDFDVTLGKAIADVSARRAINPLAKAYKEAGGGEAGVTAVQAKLKQFAGANQSKDEVSALANARMKETDAKLEVAMQKLRNTVADQLAPKLDQLLPKLVDLIPQFTRLLEQMMTLTQWVAENPMKAAFIGLGASITRTIIAEVAAAKIGEVIKRLITTGSSGSGLGSGLGTAGKVAAGAAIAATAYVGYEAGKDAIDTAYKAESNKLSGRTGMQIEAANLASAAKNGGLTADQAARARELAEKLKGDIQTQKSEMDPDNQSWTKKITAGIGSVIAPGETAEAQKVEQAQQTRTMEQTQQALDRLITALDQNTTATRQNSQNQGNTPGGAPNPPPPPIGSAPVSGGRGPTGS